MKKLITYFLIPLGILLLNIFLVLPLFKGEFTQSMGSIEAAYISDARWVFENIKDLSWNPLWYLGFPFHLSYAPVFPFFIALFHFILKSISIPHFYRILTAVFYCIGPISLYFFVRYLTKKTFPALVSVLVYTLPTLSLLFLPGLKGEMVVSGFVPWQLLVLAKYGEGPHIASLSLVPLVALLFLKVLRKPSFKKYLLVAILSSFILLINILSFFSLLLMLSIVLFSEMVLEKPAFKFKSAFSIFLLTLGLSAFWYNLSFFKMIFLFEKGGSLIQNLLSLFPFAIIMIPIFVVFSLFVFEKKPKLQPLFIGFFWFLTFFIIIGSWFYFERIYFPQPNRFIPELNLAISLLIGLAFSSILSIIRKYTKVLSILFAVVIIAVLIFLNFQFKEDSWKITSPNPDINSTPEYRISKWLSENTDGKRVYTTGSICFWLNVFSDTPQVRGGADGASYSKWWAHATYQINTSENAPKGEEEVITLNWLKAINVSYAVVNFPHSKEIFHDYKNPDKFEEIEGLEEVYNEKGDVIYKVPLENPSLVQIVDKEKFDNLKSIYNAVDVDNLQDYVDYIEDSGFDQSKINLVKKKNTKYEISADLEENEAIALQISYNPVWKAYVNGKRVKIQKDVIDFMFIEPEEKGEVEIILKFGRTWDVWLGYFITLITLLYILLKFRRLKMPHDIKEVKTK